MSSRTFLVASNRKSNLINLIHKRTFVSSCTEKLKVDSFRHSWIQGLILLGSRSERGRVSTFSGSVILDKLITFQNLSFFICKMGNSVSPS